MGIGEGREERFGRSDNIPTTRSPTNFPMNPTTPTPSFTVSPDLNVTMASSNSTDNSTFMNDTTTAVTPTLAVTPSRGGRRWWNQNSNQRRLEASRSARSLVPDEHTEQKHVKRDLMLEAEYAGNEVRIIM